MAEQEHQHVEQRPATTIATWVQQLQSHDPEEQTAAVHELSSLVCDAEGSTDLVVSAGAVPILLGLLSNCSISVQEDIACLLATIVLRCKKSALPVAQLVAGFIGLLKSDSRRLQRAAAFSISELAHSSKDNKATISSVGAIPVLEMLCESKNIEVQQAAADALCMVVIGSCQQDTLIPTQALSTVTRFFKQSSHSDESPAVIATGVTAYVMGKWAGVNGSPSASTQISLSLQQDVQIRALRTLSRILDDSCQHPRAALALQLAAGIPSEVMPLLQDESSPVQLPAVWLLTEMMEVDGVDAASSIAAAGAIPALIAMLHSKRPAVVGAAVTALRMVLTSDINRQIFVDARGLDVLAALLHEPNKQKYAIDLLVEITEDSPSLMYGVALSIQSAAAGVLLSLAQLLQSQDTRVIMQTACVMARLSWGNNSNQTAVAAAGTIPVLVALLNNGIAQVQGAAGMLLEALVLDHSNNTSRVMEAGGIPAALSAIRSPDLELQQVAVNLLGMLVRNNSIAQSAAIASGALSCLLPLLEEHDDQLRTHSAAVLGSLALPCSPMASVNNVTAQSISSAAWPPDNASWHALAAAVPALVSALKHEDFVLHKTAAASLMIMLSESPAVVSPLFRAAGGLSATACLVDSSDADTREMVKMILKLV